MSASAGAGDARSAARLALRDDLGDPPATGGATLLARIASDGGRAAPASRAEATPAELEDELSSFRALGSHGRARSASGSPTLRREVGLSGWAVLAVQAKGGRGGGVVKFDGGSRPGREGELGAESSGDPPTFRLIGQDAPRSPSLDAPRSPRLNPAACAEPSGRRCHRRPGFHVCNGPPQEG